MTIDTYFTILISFLFGALFGVCLCFFAEERMLKGIKAKHKRIDEELL